MQRFVGELLAARDQAVERIARWQQDSRHAVELTLRHIREPAARLNRWVEANRDQILRFAEQLEWLQRLGDEARDEWNRTGLAYLVTPLDISEQLVLSLHATPGDTDALVDFIEDVLADPELVDNVCTALDEATVLSDPPRDHLKHGLRHLQDRDVLHAWPPLIIGLEGAFADVVIAEGYAVRQGNHVHLLDAGGNVLPERIPSVEGVAKSLGHGSGQSDFGDFLVRHVYGGEGNPFRHGTAQIGIRERTICLAVAVIGWLDVFVAPGSRDLLTGAIRRELELRDTPT